MTEGGACASRELPKTERHLGLSTPCHAADCLQAPQAAQRHTIDTGRLVSGPSRAIGLRRSFRPRLTKKTRTQAEAGALLPRPFGPSAPNAKRQTPSASYLLKFLPNGAVLRAFNRGCDECHARDSIIDVRKIDIARDRFTGNLRFNRAGSFQVNV